VIFVLAVVKVAKRDVTAVRSLHLPMLYLFQGHNSTYLDLYDIFPLVSGTYRPHVRLQPLGAPLDDTIVLHEEVVSYCPI